jgi:predicted DNA-binding protein with PD1-like motif
LITDRRGNLLLVRLVHGDDLLKGLKSALKREGVTSGVLLGGVGMLAGAEIGYYAGDGRYEINKLDEEVELCAVNGNISTFDGEYVIHMHVTGGKQDGCAVAGHLLSATVHMTCEMAVMVAAVKMVRKLDEETKLKLLWFED